ncbi:hypothetical protein HKBW3S34_02434, partial [Candidatus Hakubella thermalkaliphila]
PPKYLSPENNIKVCFSEESKWLVTDQMEQNSLTK